MKNLVKILTICFIVSLFSCNKEDNLVSKLECKDSPYCGLLFVLDRENDFTKNNFSDTSKVYFYKKENGKEIRLDKEVHIYNKFTGLSISRKHYHEIITGKLETFYLKASDTTLKIELKANISELETVKKVVLHVDKIYINGVTPRGVETDSRSSYEFLLKDYKMTE